MTVFLLLYLCADATRTDCQVVKADSWNSPLAYEQCTSIVPGLTKALTAATASTSNNISSDRKSVV